MYGLQYFWITDYCAIMSESEQNKKFDFLAYFCNFIVLNEVCRLMRIGCRAFWRDLMYKASLGVSSVKINTLYL